MASHLFFAVGFGQIDGHNFGRFGLRIARFQFYQPKFAIECVAITLDRRRGTAEQRFGFELRRQHQSGVAGVVAWRSVNLLVRRVVFLVHHHQPQISERQKECRPCADNDLVRIFAKHIVPNLHAFGFGKFGVIHRHFFAENIFEPLGQLRGQRNFWHEKKHLLARRQCVAHQVRVEFGFAAGRYAVQQHRVFFAEKATNFVVSVLLVGSQWRSRRRLLERFDACHFALLLHKYASVNQLFTDSRHGIGTLQQIAFAHKIVLRTHRQINLQKLPLFFGSGRQFGQCAVAFQCDIIFGTRSVLLVEFLV